MYASMSQDHARDQDELNQAYAAFTTCNTRTINATGPGSDVKAFEGLVTENRAAHGECRNAEGYFEGVKAAKWTALQEHMQNIDPPPSPQTFPGAGATYEQLQAFFSDDTNSYLAWIKAQQTAFNAKEHEYEAALTNWTTKGGECDRKRPA